MFGKFLVIRVLAYPVLRVLKCYGKKGKVITIQE
jgi:hypothetical protein